MKYLFFFITLLSATYSNAQEKCGTSEQHNWLMQNVPEYARLMQNRSKESNNVSRIANVTDTIPLVVHVIFLTNMFGTFGDVSDASINKAIDDLNRNFNDPTPGHANIGIYFKLAQTDPDCHSTSGIIRVDASNDIEYANYGVHYANSQGGISQADLAAKSYWDNTKYLNIWLVTSISNSGVSAFAYLPTGTKTIYDGIVLSNLGPLVHEMGHAFNLLHSFEGSIGNTCAVNNDCNVDGDHICDTPPILLSNFGCDSSAINPCTNQPYGNIVYNHMGYYGCRNQFTSMQMDRMRNALFTYRASLLSYNTELPPPKAPLVTISSDDNDNIIDKNQTVSFTPLVTGGSSSIQYHWLKNNSEVSFEQIFKSNSLAHGDEIVCMVVDPTIVCHTPVKSYSNKIKISTDHKHYVSIYPNPTIDKIFVWTPTDDIKINMIRLFTSDGKLLDIKKIAASSKVQYTLENRIAGLYILEFTSNKGIDVIRVVKGEFKIY